METWNRVLDATEQALSAAEATNVLAGPELLWRRQRLTEERRWLVRLKELGPYDPFLDFVDPQPALDRDRRPIDGEEVRDLPRERNRLDPLATPISESPSDR
jgi:hypothetical protein